MPDAPAVQGTLLQFVYMCLHHVTGYFRRIDGRPLDIYNMIGPHDHGVVYDPYDGEVWEPYCWQDNPPTPPRIRPLSRNCSKCRQDRREQIERIRQDCQHHPKAARYLDLRMRDYYLEDRILVDLATGNDLAGVEERVESENPRAPCDIDTDNGYGYNPNFIYNYGFNYLHESLHLDNAGLLIAQDEERRLIRLARRAAWRQVILLYGSEDQMFVHQTPNLRP
ncbi:hypothetical protein MMC29_003216 [Sticta canariensis]|nr:hypothetical protein [Sticta canariensis]